MKEIKVTINSLNLDYVKEKIKKFNARTMKLNKKQLEVIYSDLYIDSTDEDNIKELLDITVLQYEDLIICNYKLIAKIDHTYPSKNFVEPYENITKEQEQEWQFVDCFCHHCNNNRKRNITFILQNIETSDFIQVGKTCLKDFLGHDIGSKLRYFDLLEELQLDIYNHNKKTKKIDFFKTVEVLGMVEKEINKNGYKSSRAKYEQMIMTTTGEDVKRQITDIYSNIDERKRHLPKITKDQKEKYENIMKYIINYSIEDEYTQEFYNKLKNILKYDYCKYKDVSLLATVFVIYNMLKDKELQEQQRRVSQYIGYEGDKIQINVTLEAVFGYETQYGCMHINLFRDAEGNIYKWNSKNTLDIEKKEWKNIKATIKGHEEYKGQEQTIVTRCKIVK